MRITHDMGELMEGHPAQWLGWVPLFAVPCVALAGMDWPAWVWMWAMAATIYAGCKWLTWWEAAGEDGVTMARSVAYLLAWPGMNAREFLAAKKYERRPASREWVYAVSKTLFGAVLLWGVTRWVVNEWAAGWVAWVGMAFVLHFGSFHVLALAWQRAGVNAQPLMNAPLLATSLADFWGKRWNIAFNQLAHHFLFRPLAGQWGRTGGLLATFAVSGLIHDLVISVSARGGYGLPTLYFLIQGVGLLFERTKVGRQFRGRTLTILVTAGPVLCLFHRPFIYQTILPFLTAIHAR